MRAESFILAGKNAIKMCFLYILFGGIMATSVGICSDCWKQIVWIDMIFCMVVVFSPFSVLVRGTYKKEQGWYSGMLFLFLAAEIMVNAWIALQISVQWKILLCIGVFCVGAFLGVIFYLEKWKNSVNGRRVSRLEQILILIFCGTTGWLWIASKIFRSSSRGEIVGKIMTPDATMVCMWVLFLLCEAIFSFTGAMMITMEATKRIDRKWR